MKGLPIRSVDDLKYGLQNARLQVKIARELIQKGADHLELWAANVLDLETALAAAEKLEPEKRAALFAYLNEKGREAGE